MPRFAILDVAIGIMFVYFVLSLVVTSSGELIAGLFRRRSRMLWNGLMNLLGDEEFAGQFYAHPVIRALRRNEPDTHVWDPRLTRWSRAVRGKLRNTMPSYIPARSFTLALLDTVAAELPSKPKDSAEPSSRLDKRIDDLREALKTKSAGDANPTDKIEIPEELITNLGILFEEAGKDLDKFKSNIDAWFEDSMQRVSGWYKRWTQALVFAMALVVTVATNADTITIGNTLFRDPAVRSALLAQAETNAQAPKDPGRTSTDAKASPSAAVDGSAPAAKDSSGQSEKAPIETSLAKLEELALPLGWTVGEKWPGSPLSGKGRERWQAAIRTHTAGWLITVVALTLGAPFWFDTINRTISLRAAGKKDTEKEKGKEAKPS
jgi:hypothetical protein